jgi:hypothetical protein
VSAPNGPAPAYVQSPNAAADRVAARRRALADAIDAAIDAAVRDAAVAAGATIAPDSAQATSPGRVTVDLPGVGRLDVMAGQVIVYPTIPPGWSDTPRHAPGDVLGHRSGEIVILDVLGNRTDARPGYLIAPIGRDGAGRPDPTQIGDRVVVAPDADEVDGRPMGAVELR